MGHPAAFPRCRHRLSYDASSRLLMGFDAELLRHFVRLSERDALRMLAPLCLHTLCLHAAVERELGAPTTLLTRAGGFGRCRNRWARRALLDLNRGRNHI